MLAGCSTAAGCGRLLAACGTGHHHLTSLRGQLGVHGDVELLLLLMHIGTVAGKVPEPGSSHLLGAELAGPPQGQGVLSGQVLVPATGPVPTEGSRADGARHRGLLGVPPLPGRHVLLLGLGPPLLLPLVLGQVPGLGPPLGLGITTPGVGSAGTVLGVPGPLP